MLTILNTRALAKPGWVPLIPPEHRANISVTIGWCLGVRHLFGYVQQRQWQKLVVNAVINPLSAVHNQPNGILLQHQDEITELCLELHKLAGIDYSENLIAQAKAFKKLSDGVRLEVLSAEDFELHELFEVITISGVLSYFDNPFSCLEMIENI